MTKGFFSSSLKRLHSAPNSLLISQFSMFGYLRASLRRSVRDQTMNAFIGRLMCSSESAMSISVKFRLHSVFGCVHGAVTRWHVPIKRVEGKWRSDQWTRVLLFGGCWDGTQQMMRTRRCVVLSLLFWPLSISRVDKWTRAKYKSSDATTNFRYFI